MTSVAFGFQPAVFIWNRKLSTFFQCSDVSLVAVGFVLRFEVSGLVSVVSCSVMSVFVWGFSFLVCFSCFSWPCFEFCSMEYLAEI